MAAVARAVMDFCIGDMVWTPWCVGGLVAEIAAALSRACIATSVEVQATAVPDPRTEGVASVRSKLLLPAAEAFAELREIDARGPHAREKLRLFVARVALHAVR